MSRLISFAVLIAIIIVIGLLFYKVLVGFFIPVFLAAVLVVVFRPLHHWVLDRCGHREHLAAAVTTILIMTALILPIGIVVTSAAVQGLRLIKDNEASIVELRVRRVRDSLGLGMPAYYKELQRIDEEITKIAENTNDLQADNPVLVKLAEQTVKSLGDLQAGVIADETKETFDKDWKERFDSLVELVGTVGQPSEEFGTPSRTAVMLKSEFGSLKRDLMGGPVRSLAREWANPDKGKIEELTKQARDFVQPRLLSITGATGAAVVKLIFSSMILVVATYFFLYDGPAMIKTIMRLSPLDDAYEQELLLEFDRISRAVVLATLLSAITQGLTAGIGYYFAGMEFLVLLVMLTTVFAMVPFVGPAVVWVPVCLYIGIYDGRVLAACLLAVWGIAVVGTIDNVVKAFVLHGQSQLHPLLALLSVLGGVQTLGPVGIVVGPMVVAMLQTLLGILQRELLHFDQQQIVVSTDDAGAAVAVKRRRTAVASSVVASSSIADKDSEAKGGEMQNADSSDQRVGNPSTSQVPRDEVSEGNSGGKRPGSRRRSRRK